MEDITIVIKIKDENKMPKFEIDGNKLIENQDEYLKETFDLPVFDGDFEDIYQYLIGFYSKTLIVLKNVDKIDLDLLEVFERASDYNNLVQIKKEE